MTAKKLSDETILDIAAAIRDDLRCLPDRQALPIFRQRVAEYDADDVLIDVACSQQFGAAWKILQEPTT